MNKKGFALFITILLILVFSAISVSIIETKTMSNNIDLYKYYQLQSKVHIYYISEYIKTNKKAPNWDPSETLYNLEVYPNEDNTIFDIFVSPTEDVNVRVYKKVILN